MSLASASLPQHARIKQLNALLSGLCSSSASGALAAGKNDDITRLCFCRRYISLC
ncbi:uncharacterized protein PHACADRAFT_266457 [Phanerochaete carnosa HHB-10118-sp]|uniref:Uncharacterized protein n=1 Tax=Phanerochaete carnosa (strain HHB-10118-sp) TaxID=650164 RepID=K5W7G0_PHACS|nr:uncharacterized protein PHACADRAFT_259059 [Phanerochaete carnosa HHB-10118-sp]XP_007403176.1 uncharacterized protein PHACADRAFT_266457 [Phanerochaete carnosa HHB-10118-sp]EKM48271.1 hypothetical protein PHACADRAFT_266457 [Phanerochaete carnosa HHB-10118-sp]EKM54894.1 hypothetical protein PHACADRAFT_259059 [Phanerochaete carnosa HHB-10118-sp]